MSSWHFFGAKALRFLTDNFSGLVSIFLLLALTATAFFRRKTQRKPTLNSSFPRIKWSIDPLSFLDGYITLIKLKNDGLEGLSRVAKQYGKVFTAPVLDTDVTVISDPDIIHKLLKSTDSGHLNKIRFFYDVIFSDGLKDGLVPADVGIWAPHRKIIGKAFTYKSFGDNVKTMNKYAIQLSKTLLSAATENSEEIVSRTKLIEVVNNCVVETIVEIVMGSEILKTVTDKELAEAHHNFNRAKDICHERIGRPALLFRPFWLLHPMKREIDYAITQCREFCLKLANAYRTTKGFEIRQNEEPTDPSDDEWDFSEFKPDANASSVDFGCALQEMLKANFSEKEIADESGMLMAAGHDTTVKALDFLLFHLAVNPIQQRRCHAEVDIFFQSRTAKPKESYGLIDYSELEYLERCIKESLRLVPTIPIFGRTLNSPLKISEELQIDANTNVIISPWLVHRDPELYLNPETFDPDRFLPENVKQRHSHSYIPFSLGVRNCVGWKIALMEMKIVMAWLLKDFEITSTDKPEDVRLLFGLMVKPEREYDLNLKRRLS